MFKCLCLCVKRLPPPLCRLLYDGCRGRVTRHARGPCAGWTSSPVTMSTLISHSSAARRQSHPSCRYSILLRALFRRTSADEVYIRRCWRGLRSDACGMGWTATRGAKDTAGRTAPPAVPHGGGCCRSEDALHSNQGG